MVETVLTTSAMSLFDVAKNVTSSTVPEKKKNLKTQRSSQSQGHCDLRKRARYPGSGPYSLDWAPCGFWLFPPHQTKANWPERKFSGIQDQNLANAVNSKLYTLSPSDQ